MPRAPVSDDEVDEVGALNAVRPAGISGRRGKLLGLDSGGRIERVQDGLALRSESNSSEKGLSRNDCIGFW